MAKDVGVLSAAYAVPAHSRAIRDLFAEEGAEFTPETVARLGIEEVHLCDAETSSQLALGAAQEAIRRAGIPPSDIQVVIDYTVLPQEYLAPAWNMSGKIQAELGIGDAFTLGFSGGGSSNFLVALSAATALIQANDQLNTALLVAGEVTIPGNRVLNPQRPLTVLGDGGSAVVVQGGARHALVLGTELWSDGRLHDVCYIPGGALAHPDRPDLYRMQIEEEKYDQAPRMEVLARLMDTVLQRAGLRREEVSTFIYPNLSAEDQAEFMDAFRLSPQQICLTNGPHYGHVQGTDLVLNYLSACERGALGEGTYSLLCSHGMGFLSGVTLMRN